MKDATGESVSVRVSGRSSAGEEAEFGASGKIIAFHGFLKAYVEDVEDDAERDDRERRLPPLAEGDPLTRRAGARPSHATRPPARYTEATPGQGAGGPGDRPALHLRLDHRHDPRPGLRVQEGHRAGPLVPRLRRGHPAGAALRPPG